MHQRWRRAGRRLTRIRRVAAFHGWQIMQRHYDELYLRRREQVLRLYLSRHGFVRRIDVIHIGSGFSRRAWPSLGFVLRRLREKEQ